jgi:hypothetical protein
MKVLKARITSYGNVGEDVVVMTIDAPKPSDEDKNLEIVFQTERGKAEEYLQKHFPSVPYTKRTF